MIGKTISHYRIVEKLGEGGMGVVYKAEDENLRRPVALKFLRAGAGEDRQLRGRFGKEAEAAAALDHPNITTIYEIGEADGHTFIAMALVEGESLAAKIKRRPLPLEEALRIAIQVAEALQAAHERGVVHRDIKPGNIMITAKGQVKVMDFGLAHLAGQTRMTKTGTIMGTPAYMSPEQARGEAVDQRSDIWSLGVVLYEMVAGRLPFPGESGQIVALAIQNEEPEPLTAVRAGLPMELERIVGKALAKEPEARYQHADELVVDLRSLVGRAKSGGQSKSARTRFRRRDLVSGLLVTCLAVALFVAMYFRPDPAVDRPVSKWSFTPDALTATLRNVVVSPNGRHIAYRAGPGEPRLWVRDLDSFEPRALPGTEGADHGFFWSPDSRFLGFAANTELKKISLNGGPAITLCTLSGGYGGGSWSPDGSAIAFGSSTGVSEVPSAGGEPKLLFERVATEKGGGTYYPQFLPPEARDRSVLVTVGGGSFDVVLKNLETGEWQVLAEGNGAFYSPSGHIVFRKAGGSKNNLWALPFSLDTLQPTGEPFPVVENASKPTVSEDGTLVFVGLPDGGLQRLVWRDRNGNKLGEIGQPQAFIRLPALSPDGRSVAVQAREGGDSDIWVHDVARPVKRRLTFHDGSDGFPIWSPAGRTMTFSSRRGNPLSITRKAADGTGGSELLLDSENSSRPYGWSPDGNYLVYEVQADSFGIFYLQRKSDGIGYESIPFLDTPADERSPRLSPDGKFIAYCSDESGKSQVWVRPFPSGEGLWQVSSSAGCQPRWSRDGKELFYVDGATLMAVTVATSPVFTPASAKRLFSDSHLVLSERTTYDVSADGRFVLVEDAGGEDAKPPSIHVVENWYEEFRDRQ